MTPKRAFRLLPLFIWVMTALPICAVMYGFAGGDVGLWGIIDYTIRFGFTDVVVLWICFWIALLFPVIFVLYELTRLYFWRGR